MDLIFLFYYKEPLSLDKRATSSVYVRHELQARASTGTKN